MDPTLTQSHSVHVAGAYVVGSPIDLPHNEVRIPSSPPLTHLQSSPMTGVFEGRRRRGMKVSVIRVHVPV